MPARTLEGLLVVAMEQAVAAPVCTSRLADSGARVIKVERAEGDFARRYDRAAGDLSSYFVWANRGKESLVADIKNENDRALLMRLISRADIFVQNLAPGAAARAGFGSDALRATNPRLITLDISGYGAGNSYSHMKAYDLLIQAETGLAELTGHPAGPGRVGISVCDVSCGMYAHAAVLEALLERERTGMGCAIQVSLFDSIADWMNVPLLYKEGTGVSPKRVGLAHPSLAPYGAFRCADGAWLLISIQNEREWALFCDKVLGDASIATAEGFDGSAARVANREAVDRYVANCFAAEGSDTIAERLDAAGTAWGRVNDLDGLARHPALRRVPVALPDGESIDLIAPPAIFDGDSNHPRPVPGLGSHSTVIRAEFSDFNDDVRQKGISNG
jgi:crotonobetainyl-CoA:carnitine CoA-transferase CaiB-like acyl-CoA transferase